MQFFYCEKAGLSSITLRDSYYHSLVRVRRKKSGDIVPMHNMQDGTLHEYIITSITKKEVTLELQSSIVQPKISGGIILGWGLCDAKTVYRTLPILNQLGVQKIYFLLCARSQGNISLSPAKIRSILISSSEQCGRNTLMEWEQKSLVGFLNAYPQAIIADLGSDIPLSYSSFSAAVIGPEGGFTEQERNLFSPEKVRKLHSSLVLKSETACIAVASKTVW